MTSAYVVIFIGGLLGNTAGLYVVCKKKNWRGAATNVLIANLATADLLLSLTIIPYSVAFLYVQNSWFGGILGYLTCTALFFTFCMSIAASVLTILAVSIDRFYVIFYPLKGRLFRRPKVMSAVIWVASILLMSPNLLVYRNFEEEDGRHYCLQMWFWEDDRVNFTQTYHVLKIYHVTAFVLLYAAPLSIIAVLHVLIGRRLWLRQIPGNSSRSIREARLRHKRKVLKLFSVIVTVFALFWIPTYVMHYYIYFDSEQWSKIPVQVFLLSFWITHTISSINPCLYILFNSKFRKDFISVWKVPSFFSTFTRSANSKRESSAGSTVARGVRTIGSRGRYNSYDLPRARATSCSSVAGGASLKRVTARATSL